MYYYECKYNETSVLKFYFGRAYYCVVWKFPSKTESHHSCPRGNESHGNRRADIAIHLHCSQSHSMAACAGFPISGKAHGQA